jgi:hypothetical protein
MVEKELVTLKEYKIAEITELQQSLIDLVAEKLGVVLVAYEPAMGPVTESTEQEVVQ